MKHFDILLVEDNLAHAEIIKDCLESQNTLLRVHHIPSAVKAIHYLFDEPSAEFASAIEIINLIILDLKMPGLSGLDILRQIKENQKTKSIPTVILTSSEDPSDIRQAMRNHANSYLVKPLNYDDFLHLMQKLKEYWYDIDQAKTIFNKPS